jgi:TM2 domain-containing membrane protein YozV
MSAERLHIIEGERSKGRSLLFSLICPGLGQIYQGNLPAALVVLFLRIAIPIIPAVCFYDTHAGSFIPSCIAIAVFFLVHVISCVDVYISKVFHPDSGVVALFSFFMASWIFTVISCSVFLQLFPVKKIPDTFLYPSFFKGAIVSCSVRSSSIYESGDIVLFRQNGILTSGRIIAVDEADHVDCINGQLSVNGDQLEEAPAGEVEKPGNEHFFREKGLKGWYFIYRFSDAKNEPISFHLRTEKGMVLIVPDNRIDGVPRAVNRTDICYRIESITPLSGGYFSVRGVTFRSSK